MARLNEIEKYYIHSHRDTMTAKEISEKMRKAVTSEDVKEYVEHLQGNEAPPNAINAADAMGGRLGVVIMTEAASEIGDEHGEEVRNQQVNLDTSTIHRIKEDK